MAEEYKTLVEWRRVYKEKEALMKEWGYEEVTPYQFYRELFPEGSLQKKGESCTGKANVIANNLMLTRSRMTVISDGLEDLSKLMEARFGLIGPFSSFGKSYKKDNAHELFALAIDIDYVSKVHLKRLLRQFQNWEEGKPNTWKRLPPTYIVSSGRGIHLYYFLEKPIELYKHRAELLTELKMALVYYMWNESTSLKPTEPDKAGIYQCFRCVGSLSKICLDKDRKKIVTREYPVKAYKISNKRFTLEEIRDSIEGCTIDLQKLYKRPELPKGKVSLEEAKELYPEWYERRIVKGESPKPHKKTWVCNKALYEWWKRKVREEAKVGGRYYAIVALCCYGRKCGISDGKIRKDAWQFYDFLESITDDEANHFSKNDMRDALSVLNDPDMLKTIEHTRQWIADKTKIVIKPSHRPKGERMNQKDHLQSNFRISEKGRPIINECKANRELALQFMRENGEIAGRPDKAIIVANWRANNPNGKKVDCNRDTGLDPKTIRKWWNSVDENEK